jgi:PAS domain S-box-containing protein
MKTATRILIVDDNEPTRYALCRMLQIQGYEVEQAGSGAQALREAEKKPDLIILDVRLPDTNGYELCRQLKTSPHTAAIPVMHLSATFQDSESRAVGLEHGADGYLTYPVEPRELFATVEAILRARRAERRAREQSELLRVTLASIGEGVIATDLTGHITFVNPVAEAMTGIDENEAVGQSLNNVFHVLDEETRQAVDIRLAAAATAKRPSYLLVAKDGTERFIEDSVRTIQDSEENRIGTVIVFRDVTERRKVETSLIESNRHKDEFLAMLAHELRNPLAPISNALHVLNLVSSQEPAAVEARSLIERQIEQLVRLVDDLLDVSRITRGLIKLQKECVDLSMVIGRAVESSKPLIDARQHILQIDVPDKPIFVFGDIVRLAQVLLNLLNNAAKYTPEGGRITLTVRAVADRHVEIKVRDTGDGIAADKLPRIFDLFTQLERTLERAAGGLGIGLTLVHRLTELHGGSVRVASPGPGLGSEFTVVLPMAATAPAAVQPAPPDNRHSSQPVRRVLVVDDNRDSADSLATLLRLFGHDVRAVYDGKQALTVAKNYCPDLVLLDLGLPGLNGFEVAKQLRQIASLKNAYIVALTGYGTEEDRRQTNMAGFNAHFIKPIDISSLQVLLRDSKIGLPAS